MEAKPVPKFVVAGENPTSVTHAARTAVAAVTALLITHLMRLPEAYWAPISTIVVMQSTLEAAVSISLQRFAGTALGAASGALVANYFPGNTLAFGLAVFAVGAICAALQVDRTAYRYAGITLAIVILIPHQEKHSMVAVHRFVEVSLGIAVGLAFSLLWPDRQGPTTNASHRNQR